MYSILLLSNYTPLDVYVILGPIYLFCSYNISFLSYLES